MKSLNDFLGQEKEIELLKQEVEELKEKLSQYERVKMLFLERFVDKLEEYKQQGKIIDYALSFSNYCLLEWTFDIEFVNEPKVEPIDEKKVFDYIINRIKGEIE